MSLRKLPTLTPALLAANRRNAQKSTGPRTRQGKAWSRLNRLKSGGDSPQYVSFLHSLMNAPPGQMGSTAEALLRNLEVRHPQFVEMAELAIQAEIEVCTEARLQRTIWG